MTRLGSGVVGLLDLPEGDLRLILSFLGTLSLADACLTCRALREAVSSGRKRVLIYEGLNKATARASPRVLQTMHTFKGLLDCLHQENLAPCAHCSSALYGSPTRQFERFLQKQLVMNVAPEVESLVLRPPAGLFSIVHGQDESPPPVLYVALARMQRLERLHVRGPFHSAILPQLPALGRLTCLELDTACSNEDIQAICSTLSLSRFGVFFRALFNLKPLDLQQMLAALAAGSMAGLRELALPLPAAEARHLSRLAPLAALTALELRMEGTFADLLGLAILTGLKSLDMEILPGFGESQPVVKSLSPLTALTGLTLLGIRTAGCNGICSLPSDVSMLSALAALRVLRCSSFGPAELFPGDPLPVQFRFLRSATALEELELGFWGSFWSLPHASSLAMREAVCALTSLKKVAIKGSGVEQWYVPLSVFAAASSVESFKFINFGPLRRPLPAPMSAQALACFKAMAKLQNLKLVVHPGAGHIPHGADLLAGLPSACLTSLELHVPSEPVELAQQIARFRDLQCLELKFPYAASGCLAELSDLKCLTRLWVCVDPGAEGSAISAEAEQLRTVIDMRAHQVGAKARVSFSWQK